MKTTLKQTEDDVYKYITNKFGIGWSPTKVVSYYQNLNYREREEQGKDIKTKLKSILSCNDWDDLQRDNKFTINSFVKKVYNGRAKETEDEENPLMGFIGWGI